MYYKNMSKAYLNDKQNKVPENTIVVVPFDLSSDGFYEEVIQPLQGDPKRDWFSSHFYYCLPLTIGNQYGFVIKSMRDFEATWDGTSSKAVIKFMEGSENPYQQVIDNGFGNGIITIQNMFQMKTPEGINLMTIQPPNMYIPGTAAMTGVVETDNLRRDFTFNLKITVPNYTVKVKKGDPLGAFIPIKRYFVDNFKTVLGTKIFDKDVLQNELNDQKELSRQRVEDDTEKPHQSGRKYFNGIHAYGDIFQDHQKRMKNV